ncbi:hypothetical protein [Dactylosporangium sp. NPDC051541]|uniref:hypothetical protein n=1 Tax=Dactylosporangium sp. NPDC051541 TaxID=3363977 RepID=UPI0037B635D0
MSDISPVVAPDPFAQCPSGCVCGVRELIARQHEQGPRDADEIDAAEMRALLGAVRNGYETVRADPRLVERRHAAITTYSRARRYLNRMRSALGEQRVGRAAADFERVRERAAAVGRRRPAWLRLLRWPVVAGIGLFDVWYFSQVFRYLTSQTGDAVEGGERQVTVMLETAVAVIPGLVLAVVIAASAELLLRPLRTWREAAFRRPEPVAAPGHGARLVHALGAFGRWLLRLAWWLLPVVFVSFLLLVIAVWAALRAKYPTPPSNGYPLVSVMLLIVLLAVGTMAVKILADDPVADELSATRRRLWRLRFGHRWKSWRADRLIDAYDSAWSDLRTLRDDLQGLLRVKMLSAWEGFILRVRSLHRMTGNVTAVPWSADDERPDVLQEFVGVPQPTMEFGPLIEICRLINEREPDELRREWRELNEQYTEQFSGQPGERPGMDLAPVEPRG